MNRRTMPWPDRTRAMIGRWMSEPFYRFFSLMPGWEAGLSGHDISRLSHRHRSVAGRRAVHLSDLHLDHYLPRHDRIVTTVRDLRPHWIFITGDLLNVPEGLPHLFRFLGELRTIAPVFMTLGNHDHYSGVPIDHFVELADRHKITLLINQVVFVPTEAGELAIVGVDDPSLHRADLDCLPQRTEDRCTLLLAHAPNIIEQLEAHHHVDLILCGHSHGGQWQFPGIPTFWLPPGCSGRIEGSHHIRGYRLYVNRGLGWSFLPLRVNCRPEILLLEWTHEETRP